MQKQNTIYWGLLVQKSYSENMVAFNSKLSAVHQYVCILEYVWVNVKYKSLKGGLYE